jgi:cytochrome c peroxidase
MCRARLLSTAFLLGTFAACSTDNPTSVDPPRTARAVLSAPSAAVLAALGRQIFFDTRLSVNQNQSCAACHDPASGWTGPNNAVNAGGAVYEGSVAGRFGNRKPPSSAYATISPVFHLEQEGDDALFVGGNFWDGRATGQRLNDPAAEQALGPFLNPVEQGLATMADVVGRICTGPYGAQFTEAWGSEICDPGSVGPAYDAVGRSISAFEASSESNAFTSKFDAWQAHQAKLTPEEHQGLALFRGKAGCSACHTLEAGPNGKSAFTDFTYDNLGVPKNPVNPWYSMPPDLNPAGASWIDEGLGGFLLTQGAYAAFAPENLGKQKVPTLRNVDLRPYPGFVKAYAHNGYFKTLEGIVHFYNTRDVKPVCPGPYTEAQALAADCWPPPEVAANVNHNELGNLRLTPWQEQALVAFLRTLSDGYR